MNVICLMAVVYISDSSSVEEMVALPAVASDMPVCATPDHEVWEGGGAQI